MKVGRQLKRDVGQTDRRSRSVRAVWIEKVTEGEEEGEGEEEAFLHNPWRGFASTDRTPEIGWSSRR